MNKLKICQTIIITAFLLFLLASVNIFAASEDKPCLADNLIRTAVIPKPTIIKLTGGSFTLKPKTIIYVMNGSSEIYSIAKYFAKDLAVVELSK